MNQTWTKRAGGVVCAGVSVLAGSSLGGELTIADVAPRDAMVVVSLKDYAAMRASLEESGLAALWKDPRMQTFVSKRMEEFTEGLQSMLDEMELEKDDLKQPKGALGAAMWMAKVEGEEEPEMQVVMLADFGEEAGAMHETLVGVFERGLDKGKIDFDDEAYGEVTIYSVTSLKGEDEGEDEGAPEGWQEEWGEWEEPSSPFEAPETMHYARLQDYLLASSNLRALEDAIDRVNGEAFESVQGNPVFGESLAQLGETQGFVTMMVGPLLEQMAGAGEDGGGQMAMIKSLGLDAVRAASIGMNLNADSGVVEHPFAVLASEKRGLVALFDAEPIAFEPPAWVPADASSLSVFQVKFDELLPTVRKAFASMGEEGEMMLQGLDQAEAMVGPLLANMGTRIVSAGRLEKPFGATSQSSVTGIGLKDSAKFVEALQASLGGMLESREFQGNTIWDLGGMGGMIPIESLGVGNGFVFVGTTQGVEDALRQGDGKGLAGEPRFQQAMQSLPSRGLGFGWTDLRQNLEWLEWQNENRRAILEQQAREMFGEDPEFADWRESFVEDGLESVPEWQKDMPDLGAVIDHLGDVVTEFRATEDGFRGKLTILNPGE